MQASSHCVALIKKFDGLATGAYFQNGYWKIGYGHKCNDQDLKITPHNAEEMLVADLATLSLKLDGALFRSSIVVTQNQFDALCSLVYEEGLSVVKKSPLWRALEHGNMKIAASYFMNWNYEVSYNGIRVRRQYLVNRRKAEQQLFLEN